MVRQLETADFSAAAEVIRAGFATVAEEFGLTEQNCPKHTAFVTTAERLRTHFTWGWRMFALYEEERLVGYVSLSEENGTFELHNLAVLPECRHKGYGRQLLDFCKAKVKEAGGEKIVLSFIEENGVLKNWYAKNGFVPTGTKKFEHLPFTTGYMECTL